jgi:hypothetical protein
MSEKVKTGFLIRGTIEKSEDDIFQGHHLHQIPIWTGLRIAFLASYRCISGTIRVQICWNSMVILEQNRRNGRLFPFFPYLLIYRTEEDAGSNPSRSTKLP